MVVVGSKESVLGISPTSLNTNGELAMQVIEESSESDDDKDVNYEDKLNLNSKNAVAHLPGELVPSSSQPAFGSVNVTHSEHVQFGHNTYFHGNVVIKQIIHPKSGADNPSYTKTDDETVQDKGLKEKAVNSSIISFKFRLWHKLVCAAVCVVIIGGICVNIFLLRSQSIQDTTVNTPANGGIADDNVSSRPNVVVEVCYENVQSTLTDVFWILLILSLAVVSTYFILLTIYRSGVVTQSFPAYVVDSAKTQAFPRTDSLAEQLLIAPHHLRFVSRDDWLAQPPTGALDLLRLPAPWVIITHTATDSCDTQSKCVLRVRVIQSFHVESRGWYDIGYNFLVGGDGSVYVGRGWQYQGAHTKGYNRYSIAIAFIGTFTNEPPPQQQVDACIKLIKIGVELGNIAKDYKLFAHRQLMSTASPGDRVMAIIRTWPNFVTNVSDVNALLPKY